MALGNEIQNERTIPLDWPGLIVKCRSLLQYVVDFGWSNCSNFVIGKLPFIVSEKRFSVLELEKKAYFEHSHWRYLPVRFILIYDTIRDVPPDRNRKLLFQELYKPFRR